jgi:hypothetical protein
VRSLSSAVHTIIRHPLRLLDDIVLWRAIVYLGRSSDAVSIVVFGKKGIEKGAEVGAKAYDGTNEAAQKASRKSNNGKETIVTTIISFWCSLLRVLAILACRASGSISSSF